MECAKCSDQESLEYLFHMESNCRGLGRFHKGYRILPRRCGKLLPVVRGNSLWKLLWWRSMSVQTGGIKEMVEAKEGGSSILVGPTVRDITQVVSETVTPVVEMM